MSKEKVSLSEDLNVDLIISKVREKYLDEKVNIIDGFTNLFTNEVENILRDN